jgi:hypothetical protein
VDGKDDGGIDGFFSFLNNEVLNEELNSEIIKKNPLTILRTVLSSQSTIRQESGKVRVI